jgi:hypothetical protein
LGSFRWCKAWDEVQGACPLEIKDPDSGEVIGVVDREKIRVQASEIGQRMTVCRTFRTRRIEAGPLYHLKMGTLTGLNYFNSDPPKDIPETLDAADSSLPPPLTPEESFVKIKDCVVEVDE